MESGLVCLDTELASASGAPHVIELGAVRVVRGEVAEHFSALVRPAVPIDPSVSAITGITDADVAGAELASEVLPRFIEWLGTDWMAAHNASFDARALAFELARAGLPLPEQPMLDSLRLARKFLPEAPDHRLETLHEHLELEDGEHHRALPDAVWCWKTIEACASRMGGALNPTALLAQQGGPPLTLRAHAPDPGRGLRPRHRSLTQACATRSRVTLLYGAEPEPPAQLPVVPWLLYRQSEKSYLEAECCSSGLLKTYRLDRIHRVLT
jgi:DNA polymerase III epsilon subunit-like protein